MTVHAFTSFSFSYLNRARVLAETLKAHHSDWVLWAIITDREPDGFHFDLTDEAFDRAVTAEELFGEDTDRWLFGMDVVEACTAVKGRALRHIMGEPDAEKILYFDPDIAIFSNLQSVVDVLDNASIALTPHQSDPEPRDAIQAIMDNEISALHYGAFNLGFLAVRNDPEARRFAEWWDDRLRDWCHDRLDIGVFVDQKWCNLVPCFFDNVRVVRDPGCNVASWNLSQRHIATDEEGSIVVNGSPLKFYHFTKLGPVGDEMTRRYAKDNLLVYEIWWWYSQRVLALTDQLIPERYWAYGTFVTGDIIPKQVRERYRADSSLQSAFPQPFGTEFRAWARLSFGL
ncbi:hypothetical protein HGP14_33495 [Rhizobium sp. P32RR-XVIII]|uniref:hypothetical protein n=1 Tax=Rhizobium sp. P32RR-XVIII TaxID=2726738 RepID=UPI00145647C4|nr:hypothetical protein [Rhizobium sp. P32RR-XVIII]NLS08111.1 hypothetical protein [Rhizobium sp. P32RR-XVIII]